MPRSHSIKLGGEIHTGKATRLSASTDGLKFPLRTKQASIGRIIKFQSSETSLGKETAETEAGNIRRSRLSRVLKLSL
jgi:hypothetical protein